MFADIPYSLEKADKKLLLQPVPTVWIWLTRQGLLMDWPVGRLSGWIASLASRRFSVSHTNKDGRFRVIDGNTTLQPLRDMGETVAVVKIQPKSHWIAIHYRIWGINMEENVKTDGRKGLVTPSTALLNQRLATFLKPRMLTEYEKKIAAAEKGWNFRSHYTRCSSFLIAISVTDWFIRILRKIPILIGLNNISMLRKKLDNRVIDFQKNNFAALSVGDGREKAYPLPAALRN